MQSIKLNEQLKTFIKVFQNKDFERADELALKLIRDFPQHPFGWKARSMLFKIKGDLKKALKFIQKSIDLLPEDPESHYNKGTLLLLNNKYEEAIYSFKNAIERKKNYFEAHMNIGGTYEKLKDK